MTWYFWLDFVWEKCGTGFDKQYPLWYTYPDRLNTGGTPYDERKNEDEKRLLLRQ